MYKVKICQHCGAGYQPTTGNQRFCPACIHVCMLARKRISDKADIKRQERSRIHSTRWYAEHRTEANAQRKVCYENNRDHFIQQSLVWSQEHPEKKRVYSQKRRALKLGNTPASEMLTVEEWVAILSKHHHRCFYCGCNLGEGKGEKRPTLDHYMPLSRGGQHTKENVVPACKHCNCSKYNKTPVEWGKEATWVSMPKMS
jgi:5-methylcytosine-specific restriction endonuclease McrA